MSLIFGLMVMWYFLPTVIAICVRHQNGVAIFIVNLLLGWTMLGWIAALAWSMCVSRPSVVIYTSAIVLKDDWDRTKIYGLPAGPSAVDKLDGFTL
jgi:hypothetical protein